MKQTTRTRMTARVVGALAVVLLGVVLPARLVSAAPAASHAAQRGEATRIARVVIQNFAFHPATLTIRHETTVVWINRDTVAHTVTANDGSFDSGPIAPGQTFRHTFRREGVRVSYHCAIHPFMMGTVIVQE